MPAPDQPFEALSDYVLLEPLQPGETEGGVALPVQSDAKWDRARVLAVGPGRVSEMGHVFMPTLKVGDVVYNAFALAMRPLTIHLRSKSMMREYLIVREREICGKQIGKTDTTSWGPPWPSATICR